MHISGTTKKFAVLGHPIGHTLSPVMHNASLEAMGWDAIYLAFDVKPEHLITVLAAMHDMGFGGVNLTIPLKEIAYKGLTHLDESARLLGAVNTVQFTEHGIVGHNTDGYGFVKAMSEAFGGALTDTSLFVLGTGGAGRAVALTAARAGARSISLQDVDSLRTSLVADEIRRQFPHVHVAIGGTPADADVVVNCTPVGMKKTDPAPLPPESFRKGQKAFDLVYMYPETSFMAAAKKGGADAANGLGMLLHQGARAFAIWTGQEPRVDMMRKALEEAVYK